MMGLEAWGLGPVRCVGWDSGGGICFFAILHTFARCLRFNGRSCNIVHIIA